MGSFNVKILDVIVGIDRKVVVRFIFGGIEIKVEGVDENGEIMECKFDWFENVEEECFGMVVEMDESWCKSFFFFYLVFIMFLFILIKLFVFIIKIIIYRLV